MQSTNRVRIDRIITAKARSTAIVVQAFKAGDLCMRYLLLITGAGWKGGGAWL